MSIERKNIRQELVKILQGASGDELTPLTVTKIRANRIVPLDDRMEYPFMNVFVAEDSVESKDALTYINKLEIKIEIYQHAERLRSGQNQALDFHLSEPSDQLDEFATEVIKRLELKNNNYVSGLLHDGLELVSSNLAFDERTNRDIGVLILTYSAKYEMCVDEDPSDLIPLERIHTDWDMEDPGDIDQVDAQDIVEY